MTVDTTQENTYLAWMVEHASDAIIGKDLNSMVTAWNSGAVRLFGYTRGEMIGESILKLIPQDKRHEEAAIIQRIVAGESIEEMRTVRVRKGGSPVDVLVSVWPIKDSGGRVVGASKCVREISDEQLQREHGWLLLDAAPVAMIVVEESGRIQLANAQAQRLFGYEREELQGMMVESLVPERARSGHHDRRAGFATVPQTRVMGAGRDLYALRQDGCEVPVEIGLTPVKTDGGTVVVTSIADLTERKLSELKLTQHREELERSNKDLEQFAYVASHDLQEPLRAVAGCVQLLQKIYGKQLDARADEFIEHAVDGCTRMQALIDDLLAFSRIGRKQGQRKLVNANESVAMALQNLSQTVAETGAKITFEPLPMIPAEASQLVMLFQNLIGNAIKFRKPGEAPVIHVGAVREQDRVTLSVADNGIGIAPEHFERIFAVFQRLHTRTEYPGTGIGLAVCKRVVEHHGGRIWVESTAGKGTTFFASLPVVAGNVS